MSEEATTTNNFGPFVILGDDPENPAKVGDQLTARPNSVVPADQVADVKDEEYQWMRDGVNISMATAQIYTLVPYDGGTTVTCRYSFKLDGGAYSVINNDPVHVPEYEDPDEIEPPTGEYDPLNVSLYTSHEVVYGYAPTKTTMQQLRAEYIDKGKALSDIIRNMENKAASK